jgi:hypothetical protein
MIFMDSRNFFINFYAVGLLLFGLFHLTLILASGHQIVLNDKPELKYFGETIIFFLAAFILFYRKIFIPGSYLIIFLLIIVQLSYLDLYIEISQVNYGDTQPNFFFIILFLFFITNLFVLYFQIKNRIISKRLKKKDSY